jgi:release factor glutamine methyltransferase
MPERTFTVAEILAITTDFLAKKDPSCPRLEAELLLSEIIKLNRVNLYVNFERVLTASEVNSYRELVKRRGNHEPVAYILGHKEFYKLDLKVTPATLIPRPETEHLVDEALRLIKESSNESTDALELPEAPLAADIGTGSGAIALALLSAHPKLRVEATDISPEALEVARDNAKTLMFEDRITFHLGHLAEPLAGHCFNLICANLPYIPDNELGTLAPDVSLFEPKLALEGGPEGLNLIENLLTEVKPLLKDGGHLLLEIWPDTVPKLQQLTLSAGLVPLEPILDYSKKPRIFVAKKQPLTDQPLPKEQNESA